MNHTEFQEQVQDGYMEESHLVEYVLKNIATDRDIEFMGKHRFDISMILNGRLVESELPMKDIIKMIHHWNRVLGFELIYTSGMAQ